MAEGPSGRHVRINVGGTVFETSFSTLTRFDDSMLSALVADRWQGKDKVFIDRDPTYFAKVLNYLRDGEYVVLPEDDNSLKCLRREAEFYNLPGLANICSVKLQEKYGIYSSDCELVRINVGGKVFVTSLPTVTKEDSLLSAMVANRRNEKELFVDRDPTHFAQVLNYLRDGKLLLPSEDDYIREALRREAEFYDIPGLGMCICRRGDKVQLKESAIETYCFVSLPRSVYALDGKLRCKHQCVMGVSYESYGSYGMTHVAIEKNCLQRANGRAYEQISLDYLKSKEGNVLEANSSCCSVLWNNISVHVPKSALRLAKMK